MPHQDRGTPQKCTAICHVPLPEYRRMDASRFAGRRESRINFVQGLTPRECFHPPERLTVSMKISRESARETASNGPARLSACIIAFNEADRIVDCIQSVSFCDEVLVVDSGSTDATVALARGCGARVLHNPWTGYRSQKQFAMDHALHDHVLS